jgi:hypothetical protein
MEDNSVSVVTGQRVGFEPWILCTTIEQYVNNLRMKSNRHKSYLGNLTKALVGRQLSPPFLRLLFISFPINSLLGGFNEDDVSLFLEKSLSTLWPPSF